MASMYDVLSGNAATAGIGEEKKAKLSGIAEQKKQLLGGELPADLQWQDRPASSTMDIFAGGNMAMSPEEEGEPGAIYSNPHTPDDPMQDALNRLARQGQDGIEDPRVQVAYDPNDTSEFPSPAYVRNAITGERLDPYMKKERAGSFAENDIDRINDMQNMGLIDSTEQTQRAAAIQAENPEVAQYAQEAEQVNQFNLARTKGREQAAAGLTGSDLSRQYAQQRAIDAKAQLLAPVKQQQQQTQEQPIKSGSFLDDVVPILKKGGKQLGSIGWAFADYGSRVLKAPIEMVTGADLPTLEEATGVGTRLRKNIEEGTRKEYTQETQQAMQNVSDRNKQSEERESALIESKKADGTYNAIVDEPLRIASEFIDSLGAYYDNPRAAGEAALASAPQFLIGGGVGKLASTVAMKAATKGASAQVVKRFANSKAGRELTEKVAERANITYVMASEGISNGIEAKAHVEGMSHDALMEESPKYARLVKKGISEDKAKSEASYDAMDTAAILSGLGAGAISKLSGAGKWQGNLFTKSSPLEKAIKQASQGNLRKGTTKVVGGLGREGLEETGQEGFGKFSQNVAEKLTTNEDKELGSGIGSNAAGGLVAGGLMGGATGSVQAIPNALGATAAGVKKLTPQTAKAALTGVADKTISVAKKAGDLKQTASDTLKGKQATILDVNAVDYDSVKAGDLAVHNYGKAVGVENRAAAREEVLKHLEKRQEALTEFNKNPPKDMSDGEIIARVEKEEALINASIARAQAITASFEAEKAGDTETVVKTAAAAKNLSDADNTNYSAEDVKTVTDAIIDAPNDAPYDTSSFKNNPNLPQEIKDLISAYDKKAAFDNPTGKSSKDVLTEITQASESEFGAGLQQHMNNLDSQLLSNDLKKAGGTAYRLGQFLENQKAKLSKLREATTAGEVLDWGAKWPANVYKGKDLLHKKGDPIEWTVGKDGPQPTQIWAENHLPKEIDLMQAHYDLAVAKVRAKATAAGINPDSVITPLGEKRKTAKEKAGHVGTQQRNPTKSLDPKEINAISRVNFGELYARAKNEGKEQVLAKKNALARHVMTALAKDPTGYETPLAKDGTEITRGTIDNMQDLLEKALGIDNSRPDSVPADATPTGSVEQQGPSTPPPVTDTNEALGIRRKYVNTLFNNLTDEQKKQLTPAELKHAETAAVEGAHNKVDIKFLDQLVNSISLINSTNANGLKDALAGNAKIGLDNWLDEYIAELLSKEDTNRQGVIAQEILKQLRKNTRDLRVFAVDSKTWRKSTSNKELAKTFAGTTASNGAYVGLDLNRISDDKLKAFTIVMHEYVHASTNRLLGTASDQKKQPLEDLLAEINTALQQTENKESLDKLQEGVPFKDRKTSTYQFSNVKEMMAYVLSGDSETMQALAAIQLPEGNFISQFAKALLNFLGITDPKTDTITALEKVLTVSANFIESTPAATSQPTGKGTGTGGATPQVEEGAPDVSGISGFESLSELKENLEKLTIALENEKSKSDTNVIKVNTYKNLIKEHNKSIAEYKEDTITGKGAGTFDAVAALAAADATVKPPKPSLADGLKGVLSKVARDLDTPSDAPVAVDPIHVYLDTVYTNSDATVEEFVRTSRQEIGANTDAETAIVLKALKTYAAYRNDVWVKPAAGTVDLTKDTVTLKEGMAAAAAISREEDANGEYVEEASTETLLQASHELNNALRDITYGFKNDKKEKAVLALMDKISALRNKPVVDEKALSKAMEKAYTDPIAGPALATLYSYIPKDQKAYDNFLNTRGEVGNQLKIFGNLQTSNKTYRDIRDSIIDDFRTNHLSHNKLMADIIAYYENQGWPTAKDIFLNPMTSMKRGQTMSQLFKLKNAKHARSMLAKIPNFFSSVFGIGEFGNYVVNELELTEDEKAKLSDLNNIVNAYKETLNKSISIRDKINGRLGAVITESEASYNLLVEKQAGNKDGVVSENTVAAVAMASDYYLGTQAIQTLFTDDLGISKILALKSKDLVDGPMREIFAEGGTPQINLASQLGPMIRQQINIAAQDTTDGRVGPHMDQSLGMLAISLMVKQGYLEITTVPQEKINELLADLKEGESAFDTKSQLNLVRVVPGGRSQFGVLLPNAKHEERAAVIKEYDELRDKLFNIGKVEGEPSKKPVTRVAQQLKDTSMNTSAIMREAYKNAQAVEWHGNQRQMDIVKRLGYKHADENSPGRWSVIRMAGGVVESSGHITEEPGNISRNAGIIRDLDNNMEYLNGMTEEESLYLEYEAIVNGRAMINQQKVNPQASKVARFLTSARSWMHEYKLDDKDDIDSLKVAIAEALGSGTSDVTPREDIVAWFDSYVMEPGTGRIHKQFAKAVNVINSDSKQFSDAEMAVLEAAVKAGGENLHSLDGLTALAEYKKAVQDPNATTVNSDIAREVDGITNGVISAMLQLAPAKVVDEIVRRGGVKLDDDVHGNQMHAERVASGEPDNYQTLARHTKREIQAAIENAPDEIVKLEAAIVDLQQSDDPEQAIKIERKKKSIQFQKDIMWFTPFVDTIVGEFMKEIGSEEVSKRGRDLSKPSLLVNVYGAQIARIIKNASVVIKENFYKDLMKYETEMKATIITDKKTGEKTHSTESLAAHTKLTNLLNAAYMLKIQSPKLRMKGKGVQRTDAYVKGILAEAEQEATNRLFDKGNTGSTDQILATKEEGAWTSQAENFANKIGKFFGRPLGTALEKFLGSFNSDRDQINEASQFMNDVWYEMVQIEMKRIKEKEGRWWNAADEKAFVAKHIKAGTLPSVTHANSDMTSTKFDDHLQLTVKEQVGFTSKEAVEEGVAVVVNFKNNEGIEKRNMQFKEGSDQAYNAEQASLTTRIKWEEFTHAIGVRSFAIINQSQDGAVQTAPMTSRDILNLYDAIMEGAATVDKGALLNNKTFQDNQNSWVMVMEMLKSVKRLEKMYEKLPEESKENIIKRTPDTKPTPDEFLNSFPEFADMVNTRHEKLMSRITFMNQYSSHTAWYKTATKEVDAVTGIDALHKEAQEDYQNWEQVENDAPSNSNNKPTPLNALNVEETFQKIKTTGNVRATPEHEAYLDNFVNDIIKPTLKKLDSFYIQAPAAIQERAKGSLLGDTLHLEAAASSDTLSATMSPQEVFAHEMTYGILRDGLKLAPNVRNEMRRLYKIAKNDKGLDWTAFVDKNADPSDPAEQAAAQRRYDQVFNSTKENEYLYKFASFGLTNEQFRDHLGNIDSKKQHTLMTGTIPERISAAFNLLMNTIRRLSNTQQPVNVRDALFQVSANVAGVTNAANSKFDSIWSTSMDTLNTVAKTALTDFMLKPYLKSSAKAIKGMQSTSRVVRTATALYIMPNQILFGKYGEAVTNVAYQAGLTMDNVGFKLMNEMAGSKPKTKNFYKLLRQSKHAVDTAIEQVATNGARDVREAFGRVLNDKEWIALTDMYLRTDFSSLLDKGFTHEELRDFIRWDGSVNQKITEIQAKLKKAFPNNHAYYSIQSASLGGFMSTGKMGIGDAKLNAYSIARLHNLEDFGLYAPEGDLELAEGLVDTLATLHAIKGMPTNTRKLAASIAKEEYSREIEVNGIDFIIGLHDNIKKESLEKLFHGEKTLMVKGYTHSLYDTTKSIEFAPESSRAEMEAKGYTLRGPLPKDKKYKNSPQQFIYTSNQGLQTPRATGIMGFKGKEAMGTDFIELAYQERDVALAAQNGAPIGSPYSMAHDAFKDYRIEMHAELVKQFKGTAKLDYSSNWLVGKTDSKGDARNYRYIMSENNKREFLGKEDVAHNVLGRMEADIVAKINTQKYNLKFLKEAFKDYKENYANNTRGFVEIGPEVVYDNPKRSKKYNDRKTRAYREMYRLLPSDTQRDMRVVWGGDTIIIREDIVDMAMGFSKKSIITWLDNKIIDESGEKMLPAYIRNSARLIALLWVEIVAKAKRHDVLFLPAVFLNNMISNGLALVMSGVPPMYSLRMQKEAVSALNAYKKDLRKLSTMERALKASPNHSNKKAIQQKIDKLALDIKNNPVTELIDEGIFQSITEDLGQGTGKGDKLQKAALNLLPDAVGEFVDTQTGKVPETVQKLYKFAILHPDDPTAQFLTKTTQHSDFVARYALYSYRTKVQNKSKEEAIEEAIDVFINYDVPTSPEMQWLNDMGAFIYTKFMFRAQRVIARMFRDQPARMAAVLGAQAAIGIDAADMADGFLGVSKSPLANMHSPDEVLDFVGRALGIQVDEVAAAIISPGSAL